MNKSDKFKELVKWANDQYEKHLPADLKANLNSEDRFKVWSKKIEDVKDIKDLLNPYFIGYGNPLSDILIIGKELGFEISNKDQVINESLENTFYWQCLNNGQVLDINHFKSPETPYGGIQDDFPSGHTWRLYDKFIKNLGQEIRNGQSFLDYCFITEFNYAPSQYSPGGVKIDPRRKNFLMHDYFKSFSKVLLTYRAYDKVKANQSLTEQLFNVEFKTMGKCGNQTYLLYKSTDGQRTVVLTNQLSGSAGWSERELHELAELFI